MIIELIELLENVAPVYLSKIAQDNTVYPCIVIERDAEDRLFANANVKTDITLYIVGKDGQSVIDTAKEIEDLLHLYTGELGEINIQGVKLENQADATNTFFPGSDNNLYVIEQTYEIWWQ